MDNSYLPLKPIVAFMEQLPRADLGNSQALAEFNALRQEIESRASRQYGLFALHITASGGVFGFALSATDRTAFVLILPITTYLFCARYVMEDNAIRTIGLYLRDDIGDRLPGLRWEQWRQSQPGHLPGMDWAHPSLVAFPGIALAALIWTIPTILSTLRTAQQALPATGLLLMWMIGVTAMATSFLLVRRSIRAWRELRIS
ncbi:MAG TPA: hypothetical protein DGG94_07995 [Micromonosporaceae bacterium]|nr:hypothetical protein [Micromonosporaceae bacterium]HCU49727.1 hypothetical protein [Micromonosporaceae bacterium]